MDTIWSDLHKNYKKQDWIDKPSIFAETAISYFPLQGNVLDLGAGQGQDSRYFAEHGYDVVSTDIEESALNESKMKLSKNIADKVTFKKVDLCQELPFLAATFDVVYAHLSLHYFDYETTVRLFSEIQRVLKPGGIFAFFTNSTSDPEYNTGTILEADYFKVDKTYKRYFSVESTRSFTKYLDTNLLDNHGETYKDAAKGVHNLIRYIGTKRLKQEYVSAIPYCGAIIERMNGKEVEVLMQTRWKPNADPLYSGTLEFPAGVLDKPFENIYETLAREIKEECGLILKTVKNEQDTITLTSGKEDSILGFQPFYCTQQLKNGKPWIGFIFICEVEPGDTISQLSEAKDAQWIRKSDLKHMITNSPDKFFGLQIPALKHYFHYTS